MREEMRNELQSMCSRTKQPLVAIGRTTTARGISGTTSPLTTVFILFVVTLVAALIAAISNKVVEVKDAPQCTYNTFGQLSHSHSTSNWWPFATPAAVVTVAAAAPTTTFPSSYEVMDVPDGYFAAASIVGPSGFSTTLVMRVRPTRTDSTFQMTLSGTILSNTIIWIETPADGRITPIRIFFQNVIMTDSFFKIHRLTAPPTTAAGPGAAMPPPPYSIVIRNSDILQRSAYLDLDLFFAATSRMPRSSCQPAIALFYFQADPSSPAEHGGSAAFWEGPGAAAGGYDIELYTTKITMYERDYSLARARGYLATAISDPALYGVVHRADPPVAAPLQNPPTAMALAYFCAPTAVRGTLTVFDTVVKMATAAMFRNIGVIGFALEDATAPPSLDPITEARESAWPPLPPSSPIAPNTSMFRIASDLYSSGGGGPFYVNDIYISQTGYLDLYAAKTYMRNGCGSSFDVSFLSDPLALADCGASYVRPIPMQYSQFHTSFMFQSVVQPPSTPGAGGDAAFRSAVRVRLSGYGASLQVAQCVTAGSPRMGIFSPAIGEVAATSSADFGFSHSEFRTTPQWPTPPAAGTPPDDTNAVFPKLSAAADARIDIGSNNLVTGFVNLLLLKYALVNRSDGGGTAQVRVCYQTNGGVFLSDESSAGVLGPLAYVTRCAGGQMVRPTATTATTKPTTLITTTATTATTATTTTAVPSTTATPTTQTTLATTTATSSTTAVPTTTTAESTTGTVATTATTTEAIPTTSPKATYPTDPAPTAGGDTPVRVPDSEVRRSFIFSMAFAMDIDAFEAFRFSVPTATTTTTTTTVVASALNNRKGFAAQNDPNQQAPPPTVLTARELIVAEVRRYASNGADIAIARVSAGSVVVEVSIANGLEGDMIAFGRAVRRGETKLTTALLGIASSLRITRLTNDPALQQALAVLIVASMAVGGLLAIAAIAWLIWRSISDAQRTEEARRALGMDAEGVSFGYGHSSSKATAARHRSYRKANAKSLAGDDTQGLWGSDGDDSDFSEMSTRVPSNAFPHVPAHANIFSIVKGTLHMNGAPVALAMESAAYASCGDGALVHSPNGRGPHGITFGASSAGPQLAGGGGGAHWGQTKQQQQQPYHESGGHTCQAEAASSDDGTARRGAVIPIKIISSGAASASLSPSVNPSAATAAPRPSNNSDGGATTLAIAAHISNSLSDTNDTPRHHPALAAGRRVPKFGSGTAIGNILFGRLHHRSAAGGCSLSSPKSDQSPPASGATTRGDNVPSSSSALRSPMHIDTSSGSLCCAFPSPIALPLATNTPPQNSNGHDAALNNSTHNTPPTSQEQQHTTAPPLRIARPTCLGDATSMAEGELNPFSNSMSNTNGNGPIARDVRSPIALGLLTLPTASASLSMSLSGRVNRSPAAVGTATAKASSNRVVVASSATSAAGTPAATAAASPSPAGASAVIPDAQTVARTMRFLHRMASNNSEGGSGGAAVSSSHLLGRSSEQGSGAAGAHHHHHHPFAAGPVPIDELRLFTDTAGMSKVQIANDMWAEEEMSTFARANGDDEEEGVDADADGYAADGSEWSPAGGANLASSSPTTDGHPLTQEGHPQRSSIVSVTAEEWWEAEESRRSSNGRNSRAAPLSSSSPLLLRVVGGPAVDASEMMATDGASSAETSHASNSGSEAVRKGSRVVIVGSFASDKASTTTCTTDRRQSSAAPPKSRSASDVKPRKRVRIVVDESPI